MAAQGPKKKRHSWRFPLFSDERDVNVEIALGAMVLLMGFCFVFLNLALEWDSDELKYSHWSLYLNGDHEFVLGWSFYNWMATYALLTLGAVLLSRASNAREVLKGQA